MAALVGMGFASLYSVSAIEPAHAQGQSEGYKFLEAVKDRDGDLATEMLSEPGTQIVNTRDITTGENGLHIVTLRRDTLWIRFLLQKGGNPNVRDRKGVTPLQIAVRLNYLDGVEALIKGGAQVDIADSQGETPLMTAVHQRNVPLVRLLLEDGANPDINDNTGRSARDHMQRLSSNTLLAREFEEADKKREGSSSAQQYGPSF
ncbi:ankyrin repeat domain-containing protein [uncultured Erythrobacter sp.]|uniref:ankyrin repeat domain-containing protein n=1 Tax=uncultured Erythrobacter sp. TaxID=263913 RepID=UPI002617B77B|nr:ankyrin repeat domain-containing protein [uncultured Erythrobacter sp.]